MTRGEMEAQLMAVKDRERARTAAAREAALAKRSAERPRLERQVRLAAGDGDAPKPHRAIVKQLRGFGWKVSRNTVAAILRGTRLDQR